MKILVSMLGLFFLCETNTMTTDSDIVRSSQQRSTLRAVPKTNIASFTDPQSEPFSEKQLVNTYVVRVLCREGCLAEIRKIKACRQLMWNGWYTYPFLNIKKGTKVDTLIKNNEGVFFSIKLRDFFYASAQDTPDAQLLEKARLAFYPYPCVSSYELMFIYK